MGVPIALVLSFLVTFCFTWALSRWLTYHIDLMKLGCSTLIPIFTIKQANPSVTACTIFLLGILCAASLILYRAHELKIKKFESKLLSGANIASEIPTISILYSTLNYFTSTLIAVCTFFAAIMLSLNHKDIFLDDSIHAIYIDALFEEIMKGASTKIFFFLFLFVVFLVLSRFIKIWRRFKWQSKQMDYTI